MLASQFPMLALKEDFVVTDFPLHRYTLDSKPFEEVDDIGNSLMIII